MGYKPRPKGAAFLDFGYIVSALLRALRPVIFSLKD
jgi:hypothetical protein